MKQLSAVIWKWSLWVVNTMVSSRSVCAALPRHIIVNSRQNTVVLRCTLLSERIKVTQIEMQKLTPDRNYDCDWSKQTFLFTPFLGSMRGNVFPPYHYMCYVLFLPHNLMGFYIIFKSWRSYGCTDRNAPLFSACFAIIS